MKFTAAACAHEWDVHFAAIPAVGFNRENYTYTTNETADRLIAPHTDCYKTLPRFCKDLVSVFSALSEVAWVSTKDCQQTHPIWEGFFSEAL